MPKDLTKTIHFFEAYENIYQEPVSDTLQTDTTITDTSIIDTTIVSQDSSVQIQPGDTINQQDTSEIQLQTKQPAQPDSAMLDSLVREEKETKEAVRPAKTQVSEPVESIKEKTDTIADLYEIFGVTELPISKKLQDDPAYHNFLYNIPEVKPMDNKKADAIYQPTDQSLSINNTTEVKQIKELPFEKGIDNGYDWITYVLILSFLLIGWTRLFFSRYFNALIKSIHSFTYASSLYYEKNSLTLRASFLLNFTFFIIGGTFLFQCMNYYELSVPYLTPLNQFLLLSAFFLVWYIWNYLTTGFIGFIFLRQKSFGEYFHNYNLYRKLMGISLFPIIIVLQYISAEYKPIIIVIGIVIFGILYFTHIVRGLQIFLKKNVSIFYLILYLCALEFLPMVVLYEVFTREL